MESLSHGTVKSSNTNISERRTRRRTSEGVNYISYLPSDVLLHIFFFLPFKYWIVMSAVSRQFKYLWTQVPILDLNEHEMVGDIITKYPMCPLCGEFPSHNNHYKCYAHYIDAAKMKFAEIVDRVILFHSGITIKSFRLFFRYNAEIGHATRVDNWVQFSMTRNIEHLELNFAGRIPINYYTQNGLTVSRTNMAQPYALPGYSFASKILKTLTLNSCKLKAYSLGALESLKSLSLIHVDLLDNSIGEIFSKCPVLDFLRMESCLIPDKFLICEQELKIKDLYLINCITSNWAVFLIDITTPNLLTLRIVGSYLINSYIRRAKNLVDVQIDIRYTFADHLQGNFLSSLLIDLCCCQFLALSSWCIQVLPTRSVPGQLPLQFHSVRQLRLAVGMVKQELPGLSCLLRSCPSLETLILEMGVPVNVNWALFDAAIPNVFDFEVESYWESQISSFRCLQCSLKEVRIWGFTGRSIEIEMIKFLLQNAKLLETLNIDYRRPKLYASPEQTNSYRQFIISVIQELSSQTASDHCLIVISNS